MRCSTVVEEQQGTGAIICILTMVLTMLTLLLISAHSKYAEGPFGLFESLRDVVSGCYPAVTQCCIIMMGCALPVASLPLLSLNTCKITAHAVQDTPSMPIWLK